MVTMSVIGRLVPLLLLTSNLGTCSGKAIPCGRCKCVQKDDTVQAYCMNLNLTRIPSKLPNNTGWLDLTNNNLNLGISSQFSRFFSLHVLNMSGNQISELHDQAFKGLKTLRYLRLDKNSLRYEKLYNSTAFKPLRKLRSLNLTYNHFQMDLGTEYPDGALRFLSHLEELHLDGLREKKFGFGFKKLTRMTKLELSGRCSIVSLFTDTFVHVNMIEGLIMRGCHISHIDNTTFVPLTNLTSLDVSENQYIRLSGLKNMSDGLRNAPLQSLYIDRVVPEYQICVVLKSEFIKNLQQTPLEKFSANHNFIEAFEPYALQMFPKTLKWMSLRENKFTYGAYVMNITSLTGLKEINLSGKHRAHEFPQFQDYFVSGLSHMNFMSQDTDQCGETTDCNSQTIPTIPGYSVTTHLGLVTIPVPPNLTHATYSYSQLPYHIGRIKVGNNKLKYVDVSSNILSTWSGPVTGLEKLEILDLSNNLAKHIWPQFFHNFPGLEVLNVSDNFMGMALYNDSTGIVFRNQSKLKILNLRSNYILSLHKKVFTGLPSLQELILVENSIHPNLSVDIWHMKNLSKINCRNNQIRWVDQEMISALNHIAKTHTVYIDLSLNPIACTCYNLDFLSWILNSDKNNIQFGNLSEYFCLHSSGKNQSLESLQTVYDDLNSSCHNYFGLSLGVLAAFILVLAVIISGIGYRYRWKLTYWYYAARLRYSKLTEKADDTEFEFDAFVSFAEEDRDFVVNDLFKKLETEAGIRLNLHQRNFKPGRPIATNIVDAVKNSKRTLVILTPDFLESYWCIFELHMGNMESFNTGRDILTLVMLKEIPTKDIPPEILYHIQSDSYLEYPQEGNKDVFWKTLIESLNK